MKKATAHAFAAHPVGRYFSGRTFLVGCASPSLRVCAVWGEPDEREARSLLQALAMAAGARRNIDAITDASRLARVDPRAFAALVEGLRSRSAQFARAISRQVLVRPEGLPGAVVSGFYEAVGRTFEVTIVSSLVAGLTSIGVPDAAGMAGRLATLIDDESRREGVLGALRAALERDPRSSLAVVASKMSITERTLQRRLREAGSSFREELGLCRVRAAQHLLLTGELKLAAIADKVGFSSPQRFRQQFLKHTGVTPAQLRNTVRRT